MTNAQNNVIYVTDYGCRRRRRPYGFFSFIWDLFMTGLTGGLWLIWIFVREMRRN